MTCIISYIFSNSLFAKVFGIFLVLVLLSKMNFNFYFKKEYFLLFEYFNVLKLAHLLYFYGKWIMLPITVLQYNSIEDILPAQGFHLPVSL